MKAYSLASSERAPWNKTAISGLVFPGIVPT